jgi:hypothetical protein
MEYRSFTLRLTEDETQALGKLKKLLGNKTDTAIIRQIINSYESLYNELNKTGQDNSRLTAELSLLKKEVGAFLDAFNALKTIQKK